METPAKKTAVATPNIALIKYWGRRNIEINLPFNSSLSMTLDYSLSTETTVTFSKMITSHRITLDGKTIALDRGDEKLQKMKVVIDEMLRIGGYSEDFKADIYSRNSFPGGVGIASSASGGAALVCAANESLDLDLSKKDLSIMARKISGSACRSVLGGIVKWKRGSRKDGSDSYSVMVFGPDYWEELTDLIAIVSEDKKDIPSSEGHDITSSTSPLFKLRPSLAEDSIGKAIHSIRAKDFDSLGEIVMKESNNMHAAMMDSWPPIMYLNDSSRHIMKVIADLNEAEGRIVAAYTFDAGPNPHILTLSKHASKVERELRDSRSIKRILKSGVGIGPKILETT
jgi:diphosphomevalonate decarboxylase